VRWFALCAFCEFVLFYNPFYLKDQLHNDLSLSQDISVTEALMLVLLLGHSAFWGSAACARDGY